MFPLRALLVIAAFLLSSLVPVRACRSAEQGRFHCGVAGAHVHEGPQSRTEGHASHDHEHEREHEQEGQGAPHGPCCVDTEIEAQGSRPDAAVLPPVLPEGFVVVADAGWRTVPRERPLGAVPRGIEGVVLIR